MGSVPAIVQRTASRSKRNSTARCQASSRESGEPASTSAYCARVAAVIAPRRTSSLPSASAYADSGAFSFSRRERLPIRGAQELALHVPHDGVAVTRPGGLQVQRGQLAHRLARLLGVLVERGMRDTRGALGELFGID